MVWRKKEKNNNKIKTKLCLHQDSNFGAQVQWYTQHH